MKKEIYDHLSRIEDVYWYHHGRRKLVDIYLRRIQAEFGRPLKILDVGCGSGGMYGLLKKYGEVSAIELSDYAVKLAKEKHPEASIKIGSANELSGLFLESRFDVITFFNVLYHQWVSDDFLVLKQAVDLLKNGGYVILIEPAFKCLFRENDRLCLGVRRYSQKEVSDMFLRLGLRLRAATYFNSVSFAPLLISALLQRLGLIKLTNISSELELPFKPVNEFLKGIMFIERICILAFGKMPFGVSILCIGKKQNSGFSNLKQ